MANTKVSVHGGFKPAIALAAIAIALWASPPAYGVPPLNKTIGVTLHGYDKVAYFTEGKPVKGTGRYGYEWMGAKWLFSSTENRDRFVKSPVKSAPQYGGYCAYAVSQGVVADIDPEAWKIVNGKLYLNLSLSVAELWAKDISGHIVKADMNWPTLRDE